MQQVPAETGATVVALVSGATLSVNIDGGAKI